MKKWIGVLFFIFILSACQQDDPREVVPATISGIEDMTYYVGDEIPNLLSNLAANHSLYGDLTNMIEVTTEVDFNVPGVYEVVFQVITPSDVVTKETLTLLVLPSRRPEVVSYPMIFGHENLTYKIGDSLPNYVENVYAYDAKEGYLTSYIIVDDTLVNYQVPGIYEVTYEVTNAQMLTMIVTIELSVIINNTDNKSPSQTLTIYYMNDTHGAILEDESKMGLSKIGNLILTEERERPEETIFLSGGDLLQGNLMSNYFYGESFIQVLNALPHEAFILGNHEFDWGLEEVTKFFINGEHEVQANFPLLAANVFYKGTQTRPEGLEPFTIIERDGTFIGIIGTIGYGLESSIATSKVKEYEFKDPVDYVSLYATLLRETYQVDVIIAVNHGADQLTNQRVAALSGSARVDAMFNGHTHQAYVNFMSREGVDMPVMQSGANGNYVGSLTLSLEYGEVVSYQAINLNASNEPLLQNESIVINSIIQPYYEQVESLLIETIMLSGSEYTTTVLTTYIAKLMALKTNSIVGIHNNGGTRAMLSVNEAITVGKLYEIFPFDNRIKTVLLKGSVVNSLLSSFGSQAYVTPEITIEDDTMYQVATNDYIFDQIRNPFLSGENIIDTGIYIRDLLLEVLLYQQTRYDYFYVTNEIVFDEPLLAVIPLFNLSIRKESNYDSII
jgi:2',3'-cyclic-nucleotide 2'-phosphodiesterase (5'-nucleotidase family)